MTLIQTGSENVFFYEKRELPLHTQAALQVSRLENWRTQYIGISRKVVGKSARDNPERYCG